MVFELVYNTTNETRTEHPPINTNIRNSYIIIYDGNVDKNQDVGVHYDDFNGSSNGGDNND